MNKPEIIVSLEGFEPLNALHVAACIKNQGAWGFHISSLADQAGLDIIHILHENGNVMIDHRIQGNADVVQRRVKSWFEHGANIVTIDASNGSQAIKMAQDVAEVFDRITPNVVDDFLVSVSLMRESLTREDLVRQNNHGNLFGPNPELDQIMSEMTMTMGQEALISGSGSIFFDARYYHSRFDAMSKIVWFQSTDIDNLFENIEIVRPDMVVIDSSMFVGTDPAEKYKLIEDQLLRKIEGK